MRLFILVLTLILILSGCSGKITNFSKKERLYRRFQFNASIPKYVSYSFQNTYEGYIKKGLCKQEALDSTAFKMYCWVLKERPIN